MITIIAAVAENGIIGKEGELPWHIPEDMKLFKRLTTGNTVVMGRKTFESIGKPLPDRNNIVVSTTMKQRDDVDVCRSMPEAMERAESYGDEIFIIGGESVYRETLGIADRLCLSLVKKEVEGDTYFPEVNWDEWELEDKEEFEEFDFMTYEKKDE